MALVRMGFSRTDIAIGLNGDIMLGPDGDINVAVEINLFRQRLLDALNSMPVELAGYRTPEEIRRIIEAYIKSFSRMSNFIDPTDISVTSERYENEQDAVKCTVLIRIDQNMEFTPLLPDMLISTINGGININIEPYKTDKTIRSESGVILIREPVYVTEGANLVELASRPSVNNITVQKTYDNTDRVSIDIPTGYNSRPAGTISTDTEWEEESLDTYILSNGAILLLESNTTGFTDMEGEIVPKVSGRYRFSDIINGFKDYYCITKASFQEGNNLPLSSGDWGFNIPSSHIYIGPSYINKTVKIKIRVIKLIAATQSVLHFPYKESKITQLKKDAGKYWAAFEEPLSEGQYVLAYNTYNYIN